jgi:LysM repeat protein
MSRVLDRLAEMGLRGHLPEKRLLELSMSSAASSSVRDRSHLETCARCRGLLSGHRRAESVLTGEWADRPLKATPASAAVPGGADRARVERVRVSGPFGRSLGRRWVVPASAAAILVSLAVGVGLLGLRTGGRSGQAGSPSAAGSAAASNAGPTAPLIVPSFAAASALPAQASPSPAAAQLTLAAYVVQTGDTWPSIATKFNLSQTEVRAANPQLEGVEILPAGTVVYVPPPGLPAGPAPTFMQYHVRSGDYFSKIASQFNLRLWELELANPQITDFNHIVVGQEINIPPAGLLTPRPS